MAELTGRSVLVAGASGGLGAPISRLLAERGARLTLVSRRQEASDALDVVGAKVVTDLRTPEGAAAAVQAALGAHGALDGVVNATGVVAFGPLEELSVDVLEELFLTNVFLPLFLAQAAIPSLPKGGFVANVSAIVAEAPTAGMVAYSATKGALTAADRALDHELRRREIAVIDLRPPHTATGLDTRPLAGTAPRLPRGLDPDDVARRIVEAIEAGEREVAAEAFGGGRSVPIPS